MRRFLRPVWLNYVLAVLIVAAVVAAREVLGRHMKGWEGPPFTLMLGGVILAAWFGGSGPGFVTTVLGAAVCDYLFIEPRGVLLSNGWGYDIRLGLFIVEGAVISWLVQAVRTSSAANRAATRNLRLIAENTSDVIFAYDMSRQLMYVNPAFEAVTGNSINELRENPFMNYIHPDDSQRMLALLNGLFKGKSFNNVEYRIIAHDGEVKWCRTSWGPLVDEYGNQIGVQGRESDISEQKRSEATLRFLAEACSILATSVGDEMLRRVARAAVGQFADWCLIDVLDETGKPRTIAAAHADATREPWILEIQRDYPPRLDAVEGRGKVLRTGQPIILPTLMDDGLSAVAQDHRHLKLLNNLSPRTALVVPLKMASGAVAGAVTFARAQTGPSYHADDLIFATDLASRIALSMASRRGAAELVGVGGRA